MSAVTKKMTAMKRNESRGRQGERAPRERRPLLRIGPGLILAIIASILIYTRMPRQPGPPPAPSGTAPQVLREPTPVQPAALPAAPDPAWLLEQKGELDLSPAQVKRLAALKARWDRNTSDLRAQLEAAERDFRAAMNENARKPVSMQELQQRAAPVAALSRQLADARQAWWGEAATLLSQEQQRAAEEAWARRFEKTAAPETTKEQDTR